MSSPEHPGSTIFAEFAIAAGAALVAGYVRGRTEAPPLSLAGIAVRVTDGVVCGFLSVGIVALMERADWIATDDTRVLVFTASCLGLIGTNAISRILTNLAQKKAGL